VASVLNLSEPQNYTSHSFRRSGATILAEAGPSLEMIKTAGGWKSDTVARKYIETSSAMKDEIAASFNQKAAPINKSSTS
jgi:integrase